MQYMSAKLVGNSMEPLLKIGDVVLVKKIVTNQNLSLIVFFLLTLTVL